MFWKWSGHIYFENDLHNYDFCEENTGSIFSGVGVNKFWISVKLDLNFEKALNLTFHVRIKCKSFKLDKNYKRVSNQKVNIEFCIHYFKLTAFRL